MSHKRLKQYAVIAGNKLSKVIEFSKGEAEIYVRNFIQTHLSNAVLKAAGELNNIKAYFCDVPIIKNMTNEKIEALAASIKLQKDNNSEEIANGIKQPDGTSTPLTQEEREKRELDNRALEKAYEELKSAKQYVAKVKDGFDFNKESIDRAKKTVNNVIDDLINHGIESLVHAAPNSGNDNSSTESINLKEQKTKINSNLNTLRKWQFEKYKEDFSIEIKFGKYHEYKYAETKEELCNVINSMVGAFGINLNLKPEECIVEGNEVYRYSSSVAHDKGYRFIRGSGDAGQWYKWNTTKQIWEKYNGSLEDCITGNLETIIAARMTAKGLEPDIVNIDYSPNEDPDGEGFRYGD